MYIEVRKGMYSLLQMGLLAQELLEKRLQAHGYLQDKMVPGLWTHESHAINFTLVVDDFVVKYTKKVDIQHLIGVLKQSYKLLQDWSG